jgi:hypothetical protein
MLGHLVSNGHYADDGYEHSRHDGWLTRLLRAIFRFH